MGGKKRRRNTEVGYGETVVTESDMGPCPAPPSVLVRKTHVGLLDNKEVKETRLRGRILQIPFA